MLPVISRLIEQDISDIKITETLKQQPFDNSHELALIYQRNRSLMIERNVLDFVGLIAEAIQLLKVLPGARKRVQRIFLFFEQQGISRFFHWSQQIMKRTRFTSFLFQFSEIRITQFQFSYRYSIP